MPPAVALSIYIIVLLYILKIDYKRNSEITGALWIPLVWMLIIGSRTASEWFSPGSGLVEPEDYLEGNPVNRAILTLLIVISIFILFRRSKFLSQIVKSNLWLVVFILYCGFSIIWSDYSWVSFKRYIMEIGNMLMVLVIFTEHDTVEALKTMFRRFGYILIPLSLVLIKYYPHLGRSYHRWSGKTMFTGVTNDKNSLGVLCMVCALFFLWDLIKMMHNKDMLIDKKKVLVKIAVMLLALWLLIEARSATSIMCFIIGATILILMEIPHMRRNVNLILICGIFMAVILQFSLEILTNITGLLGRDSTLTGRTEIWDQVLGMGTNPIIGVGYRSFWLGERLTYFWEKYWWAPTETHNGYLEIYLELGILGVLLLTGVIVSAFRKIRKELILNSECASFQMALLVVCLLYNVTESAFRVGLLMYFIFIIVVCIPRISQLQNYRGVIIMRRESGYNFPTRV